MNRKLLLRAGLLLLAAVACAVAALAAGGSGKPAEKTEPAGQAVLAAPLAVRAEEVPRPSPAAGASTPEPTPQPTPEPTPAAPIRINVRVVGDLMVHEAQQISAKTADGYDFSEYFAAIKPELSCADLTVGNLETPVTGGKPSGYPRFNAPQEFLDTLLDAGFDCVSLANNHMLDRGAAGVRATVKTLEEKGLTFFGASAERGEPKQRIVDVNGVKVALLGFTEQTNGHKDTDGQIRFLTEKNIQADVEAARDAGADVILAFPHWGVEYHESVHPSQTRWAKKLAAAGVDAILGSHPHVLEPIGRVEGKEGKTIPVAYSLGNFISNQQKDPTYAGVILSLTVEKDPNTGKTAVTAVEYLPTFVYKSSGKAKYRYEVLPLSEAALEHPPKGMNSSAKRKMNKAWAYAKKILSGETAALLTPALRE